jgi:hypothetical protein
MTEADPENNYYYWILQGNICYKENLMAQALESYQQALSLMPRQDYEWAKFMIEKVAQTQINLRNYPSAVGSITMVRNTYQVEFMKTYGRQDRIINELIDQKIILMRKQSPQVKV